MRTIEANVTASWDDLTEGEQYTLRALCEPGVRLIFRENVYSLIAKGLARWSGPNDSNARPTEDGWVLHAEHAVSAPDAILGPSEREADWIGHCAP